MTHERIDLQHVKDLQEKASEELSQYYNKDIQCYFGNYDVSKNQELDSLVVYVVDDEKTFHDYETRVFLDGASSADDVEGFKDMYDIFELEKTRGKLLDLQNTNYETYVKAMLSIELGVNNLDALNDLYEDYMRNDSQTLISLDFYNRQDEIKKYFNLTKFRDLDNDGVDDRIDANVRDSRVNQIGEMDKVDPYSDIEKQKERMRTPELEL